MNENVAIVEQSIGIRNRDGETSTGFLKTNVVVFCVSAVVFFLCMSIRPGMYDEGLILTGAMRVAAGQIPHQDFYANYGPAQFYILAGLFKLFGESILVERLWEIVAKSALVAFVYGFLCYYCRRTVALGASVVVVLWLVGLGIGMVGSPTYPISLLNLVASVLVLPLMWGSIAPRRIFAAGATAGLATLFRYDTGAALFVLQVCIISAAAWMPSKQRPTKLNSGLRSLLSYVLGFSVVVLPALIYYLSVASIQPFIHDIVVYPRDNYARARNLPFPGIHLKQLDNLGVYLPLVIIGLSVYAVFVRRFGMNARRSSEALQLDDQRKIRSFLIAFSVLSLVMYLKGIVRVGPGQMYLSTIPALLLLAVLFEHRQSLPRFAKFITFGVVVLSVLAAGSSAARGARTLQVQHTSVPEHILTPLRHRSTSVQADWCSRSNALTKGICFLPETDRIRAIEFIADHTKPGERIYVGLDRHDIVFANDNVTYFATQRMPATKWSHFDPGLQNSYPIQKQMISELDRFAPSFVIEDAEFEGTIEPNESVRSTGVFALDDYIHANYRRIDAFGTMAVWQRR